MTGPEGGRDRAFPCLLPLGLVILAGCLLLDRVALGGPLGAAPGWVYDLLRPVDAAWTAAFGPLPMDEWATTGQRIRLGESVWLLAAMGAAYLAACWIVVRSGWPLGRRSLDLILAFSLLGRILSLPSPPLMETDPYRYVWDGAVAAAGENPYRFAPAEILEAHTTCPLYTPAERDSVTHLVALAHDLRLAAALVRINHPELPTVYPPLAQGLFAAASRIEPGSTLAVKLLVALLDLCVLAMLARQLTRRGLPPGWLLLYGWCPLMLKEYAGTGHYDPAATLLMLVGLELLERGRAAPAGAVLGAAMLAKVFPAVLLPVLAPELGTAGVLAALGVAAAGWAPFFGIGPRALEGTLVFSTRWVKNASLFALGRGAFSAFDRGAPTLAFPALGRWTPPPIPLDSMAFTDALLAPVGLAGLAWLAGRGEPGPRRPWFKAYLALALLFLLGPVGNPWYLGWILPLAVLEGSLAWPLLSVAMIGYYAYHLETSYLLAGPGGLAIDLRWLEYVPFYLLFALELSGRAGSSPGAGPPPPSAPPAP